MKLIITFTIFSDNQEFIERFLKTHKEIASNLKFEIIKYTTGRHVESTREHYHVMVNYDTTNAKRYKVLNKKIQSQLALYFGSADPQIKVSPIYEDEVRRFKGKDIVYNEEDMCYPFKEYNDNIQVKQLLDSELIDGYTINELYAMREYAHKLWKQTKAKREQWLKIETVKEDKKLKLYEYLEANQGDLYGIHSSFDQNLVNVVVLMLKYYKENDLEFNVNSLKNKAINFLYFKNIIHETNIASYVLRL